MAKYVKKPIPVEAVRYWQDRHYPEVHECKCRENLEAACPLCGKKYVVTSYGPVPINNGDWIITGPDGETYPCPHKVFSTTYELAE